MTRFAVYDTVKEGLSVDGEPLPLWKLAIAGSIGGGAGGCTSVHSKHDFNQRLSLIFISGWKSRRCRPSWSQNTVIAQR